MAGTSVKLPSAEPKANWVSRAQFAQLSYGASGIFHPRSNCVRPQYGSPFATAQMVALSIHSQTEKKDAQ